MAVTIRTLRTLGDEAADEIIKMLRATLEDLEEQLNQRGQLYVNTKGRVPEGLHEDDVLISVNKGQIGIYVRNARGLDKLTAEMIGGMPVTNTNFLGFLSGTIAPTTTDFPNANDWGFFRKTTATAHTWLVFNRNGTIEKVELT